MTRWLLDTDPVSLNERGDALVRQRLVSVDPKAVFVSVVTVEEMIRGRLAMLARRPQGEPRVHAYRKFLETVLFCSTISVVAFSSECEGRFHELRGQRLRIGSQDLRIAATALVHDMVVVTRNGKDFRRVPGLLIENWTVEA